MSSAGRFLANVAGATALLAGVAVVLPLGGAQASPVNTRIDVAGNVDLAWSIVGGSNSLGYTGPAYTVLNAATPPPDYSGAWITNPASNWDTPTPGATGDLDHSSNGTYVYQTTFNEAGLVGLSGIFAADNEVSAILLNGTQIYFGPAQTGPNSPNQYNVWTGFSGITQSGTNTLTFYVVNYAYTDANPSGLNVEFTPLPSTWTMLIAGFVGFGFLAYRGTKKGSAALVAA